MSGKQKLKDKKDSYYKLVEQYEQAKLNGDNLMQKRLKAIIDCIKARENKAA